jgi:putative hydrolase of the HAD superfamily
MTAAFFSGEFLNCLLGKAELHTVLPSFLREWGWEKSTEEFVDTWLKEERLADDRMVHLVQTLRNSGYRCGLGTNQELNRARYIRKAMAFESIFDDLYISAELGTMKPETKFFETVHAALGVQPESILFIDDQEHYTRAASSVGWNTKIFETYDALFEENAELFFQWNSSI